MQKVTGQVLFSARTQLGEHFLVSKMNGLEQGNNFFCELEIGRTFKYKLAHLKDKMMNHASLEMHATMCINDAKFSC